MLIVLQSSVYVVCAVLVYGLPLKNVKMKLQFIKTIEL